MNNHIQGSDFITKTRKRFQTSLCGIRWRAQRGTNPSSKHFKDRLNAAQVSCKGCQKIARKAEGLGMRVEEEYPVVPELY